MTTYRIEGNKVVEGSQEIDVLRKVDVVVAGGGPAGLMAAIAAARSGARVSLVESSSFLGGVATENLMAALVCSHWATGLSLELMDRLAEKGAAPKWDFYSDHTPVKTTPFDPEAFKEIALEMVLESKIDLLLYTMVTAPIVINKKAVGVVIESKSGRQAVLGDIIIDCTGDADLAFAAGVPCMKGRETDQKMRPFALLFRLGGLDIQKIAQYVKENPEQLQPQFRQGTWLKAGKETVITRISGFYQLVEQAKQNGELYPECHYFRLENLWVERGTAICNTTRVYYVDGTNIVDLTKGEIEARKQIQKLITFARKYIPGCEKAYLIDTAPRLGIRETRRIVGEYFLSDQDAYSDAKFDDAIMTMDGDLVKRPADQAHPANLDVHMPDPIEGSPMDLLERDPQSVPREHHCFQIPYRVLLPKGISNLLVAGRTISVSHMIDGSTRSMLICMRMGQVAGTAAALATKKNVSLNELDFQEVKRELISKGMTGI